MVMRVGMVGLSEGNGHPFSFSAIINGYNRAAFEIVGWPMIQAYLDQQPAEAFGFGAPRVTHAWCQDAEVTKKLCAACGIENEVSQLRDMLGNIDALIIARDDWECHAEMALPFLTHGIPVFIDKPLTLDDDELRIFLPYLEKGLLMSTSCMRYAGELDGLREQMAKIGTVSLISATVLNGIEKYGIHMLDAIAGIGVPRAITVTRLDAAHQSYSLTMENGTELHLDCLGSVGKTFHLSLFGDHGHAHTDLHDNFTAFHRTLGHFFRMIEKKTPPIEPQQVINTMSLLRKAIDMGPLQTIKLNHV